MIEVYNNFCVVRSSDKELIDSLSSYLKSIDDSDKENLIVKNLYLIDKNGDMVFPRGLDYLIPDQFDRVFKDEITIPENFSIDYDKLAHSFGDILLRDDQILSIKKMLFCRRGIIQAATGSGKSEIVAGFIKALKVICDELPNIIILEPTLVLVNGMIERLKKYGIDATPYSECRGSISGVVVTHPMSLNNDLDKDENLLASVKVFISDEGHHLKATTWYTLLNAMPNLEFSIAMSASVIEPSRLPITDLSKLKYDETMVIGATGNVILDIPPSYYIERGILARPILFRILNSASEFIERSAKSGRSKRSNDWHSIRKNRLESEYRTSLISRIASFLSYSGYKSLILVGTKDHAFRILKMIHEIGLSDNCRCSFGSNEFYRYDNESDSVVECNKSEDTLREFNDGEFNILIGTSHLYEGADIKSLDCVILASIGKTLRKVIQGVGRAIRKTKTSKKGYAYIVDFTDHNDKILSYHSMKRVEMLTSIVGVSESDIYSRVSFEEFKTIFSNLEEM